VFSRASVVRNVDGRTREARIVRDTTAALVEHLGGQPTAPQQLLIHASANGSHPTDAPVPCQRGVLGQHR
jgi:hypothetical protein